MRLLLMLLLLLFFLFVVVVTGCVNLVFLRCDWRWGGITVGADATAAGATAAWWVVASHCSKNLSPGSISDPRTTSNKASCSAINNNFVYDFFAPVGGGNCWANWAKIWGMGRRKLTRQTRPTPAKSCWTMMRVPWLLPLLGLLLLLFVADMMVWLFNGREK